MKRFIEGEDRSQSILFPERLDDYIAEDNPVRAIEVFVDELGLHQLGFDGMQSEETGRPAYHPSTLLKIYIYGYLNRVQSSRRLEREAQRNVELLWLTGRLAPDFKTIADFRKDNGPAIRKVCSQFIVMCRNLASGRFPDDDDRLRQEARRKGWGSKSAMTGSRVLDSAATMEMQVPMQPGVTAKFSFTGPPQVSLERIYKLCLMQIQGFFHFYTYKRGERLGRPIPEGFYLLIEARRSDWGNVVHRWFGGRRRLGAPARGLPRWWLREGGDTQAPDG